MRANAIWMVPWQRLEPLGRKLTPAAQVLTHSPLSSMTSMPGQVAHEEALVHVRHELSPQAVEREVKFGAGSVAPV